MKTTLIAFVVLLSFSDGSMLAKERLAAFQDAATEKLVRGIADDVRSGKIIEIQSTDLGKEYASNEVVADNKYKGKPLLVRSMVDAVQKDMFGNIVVQLRSTNQFMPNIGAFDKTVVVVDGLKQGSKVISMQTVSGEEAATMIHKGSSVKMLCKGKGYVMGSVQLAVCDVLYR